MIRKFIYSNSIDNPVVMVRVVSGNENRFYYYPDALGSTRLLTNSSGSLVESYTYDPYGRPYVMGQAGEDGNWLTEDVTTYSSSSPTRGNPYLFTGRRWDSDTELYYYRFRDYSPALGRFCQTDPLMYIDGMNLYAYCGNNPLNWIDPLGLYTDGRRVGGLIDGHSDFGNGWGMGFDYTSLDHDFWTSPYNLITGTWRHFRSRRDIARDLRRAIRNRDARAFERHMHEWQDSYVHYDRGYRWPFGHLFDGSAPDNPNNDRAAFNEANRTSQEWEDLWNQNPNINDLANRAGNWIGRCP